MAQEEETAQSSYNLGEMKGIRKTAILLVSLTRDVSGEIMKHLNEEQIENVSREIAGLKDVMAAEKQAIVEEFHGMALARSYTEIGGLSYARALLQQSLPEGQASRIIDQIERAIYSKPFNFLQKAETESLLTFIVDEHPQTIALILAHLLPEKASEILGGLEDSKKVEVVSRISRMEQTSPEVIKEVETGLENRMASVMSQSYENSGGIPSVADILNVTDRTTERALLENLAQEDPELVEEIRRLMFVFDDIHKLSDRDVQSILKHVETSQWATGMKGCSEELQEKILGNMSQRAADMLREEMEYLGPIRLSEVEAMQQQVVDVIRRLEDAGDVSIQASEEEEQFIQ